MNATAPLPGARRASGDAGPQTSPATATDRTRLRALAVQKERELTEINELRIASLEAELADRVRAAGQRARVHGTVNARPLSRCEPLSAGDPPPQDAQLTELRDKLERVKEDFTYNLRVRRSSAPPADPSAIAAWGRASLASRLLARAAL
jgi:hypothetical protein